MRLGRLGRGEMIAVLGALLLALGVFLPWYSTNPDNRNAAINGTRGELSAWTVHHVLRYPLLLAALAPLVLAYVILRDHELSWPRGELTAVLAMIALVLIVYEGVIDRPGEPKGEISLEFGWFVALVGCLMVAVGGALRASGTERPRKPPGVL